MWWAIGFGGLLWIILAVTAGVMTIRNGHGWMFFFGFFLPIIWVFGAFMRPTDTAAPTY
jgi:ABC-type multidrug transport system permease subunit